MGGGAWPFLVGGVICLVNFVNEASPKRTISANGGPGPLQIISEPETGQCASLLAVPQRWVDTRQCASKNAGPQRGWIWGRSHIDWRNERVTSRTVNPEGGWIVMFHSD